MRTHYGPWQPCWISNQHQNTNLARQIPTSCLPTLLIFIHIEHTFCICPFFVAFFSATIDGRNLIFGHKRFLTRQIPSSPEELYKN
jgi:hypothetical protein